MEILEQVRVFFLITQTRKLRYLSIRFCHLQLKTKLLFADAEISANPSKGSTRLRNYWD